MVQSPSLLLCGYERGGTTLLAELFNQNGYQSGFEVGMLMCESPKDYPNYKPYVDMLPAGWRISPDAIPDMCTGSFQDFYDRLILGSFLSTDGPNDKFYDKTPIYMSRLGLCLQRTDFINKAVVITRDPRSVFVSWAKRRKSDGVSIEKFVEKNIGIFSKRYLNYFLGSIAHRTNPAVKFVSFESLCIQTEQNLASIGLFTDGVPWRDVKLNPKFANVYGNSIDFKKVFEFEEFLSPRVEKKILDSTSLASLFFGNPRDQVNYLDEWKSKEANVKRILKKHEIEDVGLMVEGLYFEPETYLLRYPDLVAAGVHPVKHFATSGLREGRQPS